MGSGHKVKAVRSEVNTMRLSHKNENRRVSGQGIGHLADRERKARKDLLKIASNTGKSRS